MTADGRSAREPSDAEGLPESWEVVPEPGWVDPDLSDELPGLGIATTTVDAGGGRSPEPLRERLRELSDRFAGSQAIVLRQRPIPHAYRVFFRHIGLDPDTTPTPVEQVALDRMKEGHFTSRNRLDDALTLGMIESGVALLAFDADRVKGRLGIRLSRPDERFEGRTSALPDGTIVIADESERAVAILFREIAAGRGVQRKTKRTLLAALRVKGVPDLALEEALWLASSAMNA